MIQRRARHRHRRPRVCALVGVGSTGVGGSSGCSRGIGPSKGRSALLIDRGQRERRRLSHAQPALADEGAGRAEVSACMRGAVVSACMRGAVVSACMQGAGSAVQRQKVRGGSTEGTHADDARLGAPEQPAHACMQAHVSDRRRLRPD